MKAIQKVYPRFKVDSHKGKAKFRNPDICNASDELIKIIPDFQKGSASRKVPKFMDIENNNSDSFNQFRYGLIKFVG
jgi:hypothetical protein